MHHEGHVGAALLAYAPLLAAAGFLDALAFGIVGAAGMVALAMVPDYDMRIPLVKHRGVTHTVAFAVLVGSVLGVTALVAASSAAPATAASVGGFVFFVGSLSVLSHVAADALTPMGVKPFWPLSTRRYSLDLVRADNVVANYLLFVLGIAASAAALYLPMVAG